MDNLTLEQVVRAAPKIIADVTAAECAKAPWVKFETMEDPFALTTIVRLSSGPAVVLVRVSHLDLYAAARGRDVPHHPFDLIAEMVAQMPSGLEVAR